LKNVLNTLGLLKLGAKPTVNPVTCPETLVTILTILRKAKGLSVNIHESFLRFERKRNEAS